MLPFGFGDGLSSTLDFPTLWQTTFLTGTLPLSPRSTGTDIVILRRTRDDRELAPRQDLANECKSTIAIISHDRTSCPLLILDSSRLVLIISISRTLSG
jgi:hypothetical protein